MQKILWATRVNMLRDQVALLHQVVLSKPSNGNDRSGGQQIEQVLKESLSA